MIEGMIIGVLFFIFILILFVYGVVLSKLIDNYKEIKQKILNKDDIIKMIDNRHNLEIFAYFEKCKSVAGAIYENVDILKYDKEKNLAYNYLVMQEVVNIMLKNQYKGKE